MEGLKVTFGHVIAFLLPGIVSARAMAYHFPTIQEALDSLVSGKAGAFGQSIFLTGVAATLGLTTSLLRGQYIDRWFGRCMGGSWRTDYSLVKAAGETFEKAVENVYRYYQFMANLALSLLLLGLTRFVVARFTWNEDGPLSVAIVFIALFFLFTAYLQFKEWCRVRNAILNACHVESPKADTTPEADANAGAAPSRPASTDSPAAG
jgi:hypothetical protein